jgi:2-iminobutanoate/2-iminopropanoate deaminase
MEEITTDRAPESIGPYSQGIKDGDTVYVSGQGPIDPETGEIIEGDIGTQTEHTLRNVAAVLEAAGTSLDNVVKVTIYLDDIGDYDALNEAYAEQLSEPYPARCAVETAEFPIDVGLEIDATATIE